MKFDTIVQITEEDDERYATIHSTTCKTFADTTELHLVSFGEDDNFAKTISNAIGKTVEEDNIYLPGCAVMMYDRKTRNRGL